MNPRGRSKSYIPGWEECTPPGQSYLEELREGMGRSWGRRLATVFVGFQFFKNLKPIWQNACILNPDGTWSRMIFNSFGILEILRTIKMIHMTLTGLLVSLEKPISTFSILINICGERTQEHLPPTGH